MKRLRSTVALALFLFGTTFLWFMPSFLGASREPTGAIWSVLQVLVVLTVLAFGVAGWAIHKALPWWPAAALAGAALGLVVPGLWWTAVSSVAGVPNAAANIGLHATGSVLVLLAILSPGLRSRVDQLGVERSNPALR